MTSLQNNRQHFFAESKLNIVPGEFVVIGDFAENYSFVVQDASQSFHWNNLQATIHPFVCYYKVQSDNSEFCLQHTSFVIISENNIHDTIAVHLYQKALIQFLTGHCCKPQKMIYFSDGCAAQYKNRKNFANLCCHEQDFGMPAEWHFFATSHGKGPCDGVGRTVKRLAARASLQRPYSDQIMSPKQLFLFAQTEIPTVNFYFATTDEYQKEAVLLNDRFESARTVAGTHKVHSVHPVSPEMVEVKAFSSSNETRLERVVLQTSPKNTGIKFADIKGYVTARYDDHWWLGCVIRTYPETSEAQVNFLHPHGPARAFQYPQRPDILTVSMQDILTTGLEPATVTGRSYMLTQLEMSSASTALSA